MTMSITQFIDQLQLVIRRHSDYQRYQHILTISFLDVQIKLTRNETHENFKTRKRRRKIRERGLIRERTIFGIMAAAVYAACREIGTPYTLRHCTKL
jgi:transcription initiation factor TFIIIB Brf1 subunit/transcription initiation factor TFIIB